MKSRTQHRGAEWSIYLFVSPGLHTNKSRCRNSSLRSFVSAKYGQKRALFSLAARAVSHLAVSEALLLFVPSIKFNLASRFCRDYSKCLLFLFSPFRC